MLSHSVPRSFIREPLASLSGKVVYVGIGWDKGSNGQTRHASLLHRLDSMSILEVYGPSRLASGVKPWAGFSGYKGPLPFDGQSVINAANKAGFAMCLSSRNHKPEGIQSNRLFETVAAGAIPIVEEDAWSPFSLDGAIHLPSSLNASDGAEFINSEVSGLLASRDVFDARVAQLQDGLRNFTLEGQLSELIDFVEKNKKTHIGGAQGVHPASVIEQLEIFLGKSLESDPSAVSNLAGLSFKEFFRNQLVKLKANWVYFGAQVPKTLEFRERFQEGSDVVWLNGFYRNADGVPIAVSHLQYPELNCRILVKSNRLLEIMGRFPNLSLAALGSLLLADLSWGKLGLKHEVVHYPQVEFANRHIVSLNELISDFDRTILTSAYREDNPLTVFGAQALFELEKFSSMEGRAQISADSLVRAVAQIPPRQLLALILRWVLRLVTGR